MGLCISSLFFPLYFFFLFHFYLKCKFTNSLSSYLLNVFKEFLNVNLFSVEFALAFTAKTFQQ